MLINKLEKDIKNIIEGLGIDVDDVSVNESNMHNPGDYQYNGCMKLASQNKKNPKELAEKIANKLSENDSYQNITVTGPGFINISFTDQVLIDFINGVKNDFTKNTYNVNNKTVFLDYGGANIAKELHVGHMRSANIGEAFKRLLNACGYKTISDVHLGDYGKPMGLVMLEIKKRNPDLVYFDENYTGEYPTESPVTAEELAEIYPVASIKSKEDKNYLEEARKLTLDLQQKKPGIYALWQHIRNVSIENIRETYDLLNTSFDLWEGESDAGEYVDELLNYLEKNNYLQNSEGAKVIFVNEDTDKKEVPPMLLVKSNGGVLYDTTELATIYSRMKRFKIDEMWYLTDNRQSLHFLQTFRAVKKTKIVPENMILNHLPFGTINGKDGKPFKTRDGDVMSLNTLYNQIYDECYKKVSSISDEEEKKQLAKIIAISALKFSDLLPNRETDYIFDPVKFSDLNGKTGPYILYNTVRIKSIFKKINSDIENYKKYNKISTSAERKIILHLLKLPYTLKRAIEIKEISELTEYVYKLTNLYSSFYNDNYILSEKDTSKKESWIVLSDIILKTNIFILNILGIEIPNKM